MSPQRSQPRIIPVVDVMGGHVVRAVGGQRDLYRPIACPVSGSPHPVDVATTLLRRAAAHELYIADLDAIRGGRGVSPATRAILEACAVPTWLDAGVGRNDALYLPALPHLRLVVGFETCRVPEIVRETQRQAAGRPVAFSLDLYDGQLFGNWSTWGLSHDHDALTLVSQVVAMGIQTLIVLDLARVGLKTGIGTAPLLQAIRHHWPHLDLLAGGGIRNRKDIQQLGEIGVDGVLVATALYEGEL
ncbi:MAG: HisA/HisF-related TIM barrel protein [Gemmataceae bacterium]|nr:HisA/HisF-related TIM barrel protein [Gemmata sp.]MDW8198038.1 HisA/HisF-related TIM barrel protein [Gemmataceae bacterium]